MSQRRVIAALAVVGVACGGSSSGPSAPGAIEVPSRAATAADAVLRHLPAGAELLIEVDLGRVRANPVIGELATRWLSSQITAGDGAGEEGGSPVDAVVDLARTPLLAADTIVLAAYGVGTEEAATATLIAGPQVAPGDIAGAVRLDEHVALLAPPALARRAEAATAGAEPSLAADRPLLALRTRAMPEKAESASLRLTGRLDFDARVALASMTGADAVPRELSVWADVVDDAALVAVLDGADGRDGGKHDEKNDGGGRLEAGLIALRERLADVEALRLAGVAPALRRAEIQRDGDRVRVVALIGPKRLRKAAERVATVLPPSPAPESAPPATPAPSPPGSKETSP
jgi:hypothetical protein